MPHFGATLAATMRPGAEMLAANSQHTLLPGGLDMLILNHIGRSFFDFFNGDVDHVRKLMETNFLSYVAMTTSALPMLKESEGNIVVVSSVSGEHTRVRLSLPCPCPVPFLLISVHALQSVHFCRLTCMTMHYAHIYHTWVYMQQNKNGAAHNKALSCHVLCFKHSCISFLPSSI